VLEEKCFYRSYNILSATYTYGKYLESVQGDEAVSTVGSSTTVTATTAGRGPFDAVSAGDDIVFVVGDNTYVRRVVTKTSLDEVVIDTAVTLVACVSWHFVPFRSGTAVTDGWLACQKYDPKQVSIRPTVLADASGASVSVEIKGFGLDSTPVQVFQKDWVTGTLVAPLDGEIVMIPELAGWVRVGIKGTGFAGTDNVSAYLIGTPKC
jgi:hypothetical protein